MKTAQDAPLESDERFNLVTLSVKNWSNQMRLETRNNLYVSFRSVAERINNAHASLELFNEEIAQLDMRGIDPLLELIWECVHHARTDTGELVAFLRDYLAKGEIS